MGQRDRPDSHESRVFGAAIIFLYGRFSEIGIPLAQISSRPGCRNTGVQNEKAITPLHETKRVTALPFPDFFLVLYAVFNIFAFLLFANDKQKAKNNAWRTPENLLLLVAAIGPFGAYGAMLIFRHKTRKLKFYLVPVFLIINCVAIIYLLR